MDNESQEIKIIGVDKEKIKISPDKKDFCVISFKLSQNPDRGWEAKFYEVQQADSNAMKRKTQIVNGSLEIEISEIDDLQKVLDVAKVVVVETNAQCAQDYRKKVKLRQELEELRQRQRDAVQKLKDGSDQLKF